MIHSDNHVHTCFSTDSEASVESMVQAAKKAGLSSLCFTDHMDYDFPGTGDEPEFVFEPESYLQTMKEVQNMFPDVSLRIGVELGLKKNVLKKALALTSDYPFDFVIGSTHLVDQIDPYEPVYWDSYGEEQGIARYYETTLENISLGFDYDVYGHIDYILRYCPSVRKAAAERQGMEALYTKFMSKHAEILREILLSLIRSGKGIEINTAGFKYGLGHPNPHETLISYYKELGGESISIGSDAHEPDYLGFEFHKIPAILKKTGFSYYTEFHQRKPVHISLD